MIPNTTTHLIFIRCTIFCLRALTPLCALYCLCYLFRFRFLPFPLEIVALAEIAFYCLVFVPRHYVLDKSAPRVKFRSRRERQELFERCWESIPDMETFLRFWFKGYDISKLCREDLKDFLAWGFLYKTVVDDNDYEELEEYLEKTERILGRKLPPGRGPCKPSRVSTDALQIQHKGLLFYILGIGSDDLMTYATMKRMKFEHHRVSLAQSLLVFPFRLQTVFSESISPAKHLSYWHRRHTAPSRLPVLFLHGVGAGLRTYTGFFKNFIESDDLANGQTGIIALEIMPISMRMTHGSLHRDEMLKEVSSILDHHGWKEFVIVAHSYGTIVATHLLQHEKTRHKVGPIILIDPVTVSIHLGEIPHNFIYRQPRKASEWQLQYFASTDIGIAHTITRRFDWSENVLWKDEIKGRTMTIVLSGSDIIVDTVGLKRYLMMDKKLQTQERRAHEFLPGQYSDVEGIDVLWYEGLNHGELFDTQRDTEIVVDVAHQYCRRA